MEETKEITEIKAEVKTAEVPAPMISKEVAESVVKIGNALESISNFLAGQTLPQVMESYAIMSCLGQIMNGVTSNQGRVGLDARTINQDAVDSTYRILASFDHLRKTFEDRKNGERTAEIVDPEESYNAWKKSQGIE